MITRYEFKVEPLTGFQADEEKLSTLADEGWRVISIVSHISMIKAYLERALPAELPDAQDGPH